MSTAWDYRPTIIAETLLPLDRLAHATEGRWGPGRLQTLIDPTLAQRFAQARADLDQAIDSGDPEAVAHFASAMMRGWHAIEQAARAGGWLPADPGRFWLVTEGDQLFVLCQHETDVKATQERHPEASVWSVQEVARILASRSLVAVLAAKRAFEGSTVQPVTDSKPNTLLGVLQGTVAIAPDFKVSAPDRSRDPLNVKLGDAIGF